MLSFGCGQDAKKEQSDSQIVSYLKMDKKWKKNSYIYIYKYKTFLSKNNANKKTDYLTI